MKKFRIHFSVIRIAWGEKIAYRDSLASTKDAAISQIVDYVEQNWGPAESDEDMVDLYTWESQFEEESTSDLKDGIYH